MPLKLTNESEERVAASYLNLGNGGANEWQEPRWLWEGDLDWDQFEVPEYDRLL